MTSIDEVTPRRDLLLIEPLNLAGFTSGLYVEHSDKLPPIRAIVVKVGADVADITPGDEIMYHRYAEEEVTLWDPRRESQVMGTSPACPGAPVDLAFLSAKDAMTIVQGRQT